MMRIMISTVSLISKLVSKQAILTHLITHGLAQLLHLIGQRLYLRDMMREGSISSG